MKRIIIAVTSVVWVQLFLPSCSFYQSDADKKAEQDAQQQKTQQIREQSESHQAQRVLASPPVVGESRDELITGSRIQAEYLAPPIATSYGVPLAEKYHGLEENRVVRSELQPISTFSVDVDTAAYSNMRRFIEQGQLPPKDAVRVEEILNYFNYAYSDEGTTEQNPFRWHVEVVPSPWNKNTHLVHLGLQAKRTTLVASQAKNFVFLVDVSGSMRSTNKLPLVQSSIKLMLSSLDPDDRISIVTYASGSITLLEPTKAKERARIIAAVNSLTAGGSTNGSSGIQNAYALAQQHYDKGGNNRVIIATDGDFNMGLTDHDALIDLIKSYRQKGIFLTTLGYGQGNYNDRLMQDLAQYGNGHYAYIDSLTEAKRVLVDQSLSNFNTIARDVKVQIEFNPAVVKDYRLIGYENRILPEEAFNNDKIDASEMGAGHSVTALYEVTLSNHDGSGQLDARRYGEKPTSNTLATELGQVKLAYKVNGEESSRKAAKIINMSLLNKKPSSLSKMVVATASFALWLKESEYLINFDRQSMLEWVREASAKNQNDTTREFSQLVDLAVAIRDAN